MLMYTMLCSVYKYRKTTISISRYDTKSQLACLPVSKWKEDHGCQTVYRLLEIKQLSQEQGRKEYNCQHMLFCCLITSVCVVLLDCSGSFFHLGGKRWVAQSSCSWQCELSSSKRRQQEWPSASWLENVTNKFYKLWNAEAANQNPYHWL